jgi:hypothetical protein
VRIFQVILYSIGVFLFLKLTKGLSKSISLVVFALLAILIFAGSGLAVYILPENFSFLLTAIWLTVFVKFVKKPSYLLNAILVAVSAFAVANKFTNIFLLVPSLLFPIYINNLKFDQKFARLQLNILGLFFYIGILPAIDRFTYIKNWAVSLFTYAGGHATGPRAVFDWGIYSSSAMSLMNDLPIMFIFIVSTVILGTYLIIKRKLKLNNPVILLTLTTVLGIMVFAKYPLIHYQFINISIIVFCAVYFLSNLKVSKVKLLLIILAVVFLSSARGRMTNRSNWLEKQSTKDVYKTVGAWTPYWSGDIYKDQFNAIKP